MRVALSNPRPSWGGASTTLALLARGLTARGHQVVVLCRPESMLYRELHAEVPCEPVLHGLDFPPASIARSLRAIRRHGSRVLLSSMDNDTRLSVPAARLHGIPALARRVGADPFGTAWLQRRADRLVHHWIVNSDASREVTLRTGPSLSEDRVSVIYNGTDADLFARAEPAVLDLLPGAVAVGYVGRLDPEKGTDLLMPAWERVAAAAPEAHLVLAGSGTLEQRLRAEAAALPRVHFLGFRRDVPQLMKAMHIVVVPSRSEAFGNAAAEAMAAGVPVVATRVGGLPEVVDAGRTGLLVPSESPAALADALIALIADPERRRAFGEAGMARVRERFSLRRVLDEYEALLARMIETRGR
jgi:glycosyltransferase involved in cell wall biosynthesis